MKRLLQPIVALLAFSSPFAVCAAGGGISVTDARVYMVPPNTSMATITMVVHNQSTRERRLIGAHSPLATAVELHARLSEAAEDRRMREIPDIVVAAHGDAALTPRGLHLMLIGLKEPLTEGEIVPLTLTFDGGGTIRVDAVVAAGP